METVRRDHPLNKVPEVTLFFWIIKVLCTTVGETFADYLNVNLNLGLTATSVVMGILLMVAIFFQFRVKKYVPVIYWLTVVFISVFGTLITDILTDNLGVPLEASTVIFAVLLLLTFMVWYAKEKTLSIHSIFTPRREFFYWLTVLFTFALGTAAGDLLAESLGLGYLVTGIIVAVVIALVAVARMLKLNSVLSFWIIYIMTRPLGASLGDWLSQPAKFGGLGLGATLTSIIFLVGIFGIIVYFTLSGRDKITGPPPGEKEDAAAKGLIWQTIITVALFIVAGISGYIWRHNIIDKGIKQESTSVSAEKITAAFPAEDIAKFRKITADTKELVNANNLEAAKTLIADLEYEWDNAQSKLKPMNGAKWTEVDDAIDDVLRHLRAVNTNVQKCKSSLDLLMAVLK